MSDDPTQRGSRPESGEPDSPSEESPFRFLDRDQWYEEDERVVNDPGESPASADAIDQEVAAADPASVDEGDSPTATEPEALAGAAVEPEAAPDLEPAPELVYEPEPEVTGPDPYDFGEPPQARENAGEAVGATEAEAEQEPVLRETETVSTTEALTGGLATLGSGWSSRLGSFFGRFTIPMEAQLVPLRGLVETTTHRTIIVLAVVVALISLLADSAAFALMVLSFVLPILIVLTILRKDVFEKEPPLILLGVGAIGLVAGLILGAFGAWVVRERWIEFEVLNFGAAGYGGVYADVSGNAGFLVWLVNGLLLPLVALAAIIAVPVSLRRYVQFRNEIMDGAILGAIGAAGYAIGASIIFFSPAVDDGLPGMPVSDWTLVTAAVLFVRPLILTLGGAMLGIAVWRYMRTGNVNAMILPAIGSVGAWLLLALGTIQLMPSGISLEFLWNLLLAVGVYILYRQSLAAALAVDRSALGSGAARTVCPHCRQVTPAGAFCANCGQPLAE